MSEYITEQEQIQQLKNWLKQYGLAIVSGIVLALAITTGWHAWQDHQNKILVRASGIYDEMLTSRAQGDQGKSNIQAKKILAHYEKTPYSQIAAFMLGRDAVNQKNYAEAIKYNTWVIEHGKDKPMKEIARLRIARILIAQNQGQKALDMLKNVESKSFKSLTEEVRGDAYLTLNNPSAAREAYKLALGSLSESESIHPILQMKFDNLA